MTKRISQTEFDAFYRKEIRTHGKKGIEEIARKIRNDHNDNRSSASVFLSHSHLDRTIVNKVILFFDKININIYVDWMDNAMPEITDKETATLIKTKIKSCNKFLFLATYNGLRSKWCNWELGVAYSIKDVDDLAILPIESKSGKWNGNEYLDLYPLMQVNANDLEHLNANEIRIYKAAESYKNLNDWFQ